MKKEGLIKIDYETQKRIAEIICKEIKESFSKNDNVYKLIKRCKNQYYQVTYWDELNKEPDVPYDGAADYFIPLTEWLCDAIHSRVMFILFSKEPLMTATAQEGSDVRNQQNVTDFVNLAFEQFVHLRENVEHFFKKMIFQPFSVMRYDWHREAEPMYVREMADVFVKSETEREHVLQDEEDYAGKAIELMSQGYVPVTDQEEVIVRKEVETYNAPKITDISYDDYVWSPDTKKGCKPYWEGCRDWISWDELKQKSKSGEYYKDPVLKLQDALGKNAGDKTGASRDLVLRNSIIEAFDWYGRLPFNSNGEIDFSDSIDTFEMEVHARVSYSVESTDGNKTKDSNDYELLYLAHWEHSRLPVEERVFIRGSYEDTDDFIGRSLTEKLHKSQQLINTFYNTVLNNAYLAMMKIILKKKSLQGDDQDDDVEIYPGAIWEVNNTDDIRVLDMGDLRSIGIKVNEDIMGFAERLTNISAWNLGQKEKGDVTATEFTGIMQESNIGTHKFIQRCYKILSKICEWTVGYYEENMPEGLERRLTGPGGETIFPSDQTMNYYQKEGVQPFWTVDQITGKFDYKWNNTNLNSSQQYNISMSNDLMQNFMPHPMINQNLVSVWNILKKGLEARNIKDWQNILPPIEAVQAQVQQQKMEMEAERKKKQMVAQMPQDVAKQLIAKGVPPNKALSMANRVINQSKQAQMMQQQGAGKNVQR